MLSGALQATSICVMADLVLQLTLFTPIMYLCLARPLVDEKEAATERKMHSVHTERKVTDSSVTPITGDNNFKTYDSFKIR